MVSGQSDGGGGLLFERGGKRFPLGEQRGALGAECFERRGGALRLFRGDIVAEALLRGGDARVEAGEFLLDGCDAVFQLLQLDGIEPLGGRLG